MKFAILVTFKCTINSVSLSTLHVVQPSQLCISKTYHHHKQKLYPLSHHSEGLFEARKILFPICAIELVMHVNLYLDSSAGSVGENYHRESRAGDDLDPLK